MSCVAGLSQMTVRGKSVESSVPMLWAHQQTGDTGTVNTWSLAGIHGTMLHTLLINWLVKVGPPPSASAWSRVSRELDIVCRNVTLKTVQET